MSKKVLPSAPTTTKKEVKMAREQALTVENLILRQQLMQSSIQAMQKDFNEVSTSLGNLLNTTATDNGGTYVNRSFNLDKGTIQVEVPVKPLKKKTP